MPLTATRRPSAARAFARGATFVLAAFIGLSAAAPALAQPAADAKPAGESKNPDANKADAKKSAAKKAPAGQAKRPAPNPSLQPVPDDPALPRVLLIGDSISMGYTVPVRERLKGRANVHRPTTNSGATSRGVADLDKWLTDANTGGTSARKWDVIHFNFGLHDLKYVDDREQITDVAKGKQLVPLADYEKNLRTLAERLKGTGAALVWCSTTPVPEGSTGRVAGDEVKYNEVAARVMKENGIPTNDLHAFARGRLAEIQRPANVHFTDPGSAALADQVAAAVEKALADRKAGKRG